MSDTPALPPDEPGEPYEPALASTPAGDAAEPLEAHPEPKLPRPGIGRTGIPGTDLTVHRTTRGEYKAIVEDAADESMDDRTFAVRAVHRQLDQDVPIEDVAAWPDDRILSVAAESCYAIDVKVRAGPADAPGETESALDPSERDRSDAAASTPPSQTFASYREAVREDGRQQAERWKKTLEGISSLSTGFGLGKNATAQFNAIQDAMDLGIMNASFSGPDAAVLAGIKDTMARFDKSVLAGLTDTSQIGAGLGKMVGDFDANDRLQQLSRSVTQPLTPAFPSYVDRGPSAEVRLLRAMLEQSGDAAKHQIEVLTGQSLLLERHGTALGKMADDIESQRGPRRVILVTAIVAAVAGVAAVILGLVSVLYAAGIWGPVGQTAPPGPTPAPVAASPSPSFALASAVVPTVRHAPGQTSRPAPTPARPGPTPRRPGA